MSDAAPVERPVLSLALDVEGADPADVDRSVSSVLAQAGLAWELLLHGDGAQDLARRTEDRRIRSVTASGPTGERIAAALAAAGGQLVATLEAGDRLIGRDALELVGRRLAEDPDADLVYADEVFLDAAGAESTSRKPAWSPQRLLAENWVGRPAFIRTTLATEVTRDRPLAERWEHDLLLRVADRVGAAHRIDSPLVHRSGRAPTPGEAPERVVRPLTADVSVAVIVPTDGSRGLAWGERRWFAVEAVRSLLRHTEHARIEVVVPHVQTADPEFLAEMLGLGEQVRLLSHAIPFDHAELANVGVLSTSADVLVILDQHAEVDSSGFVEHLVAPLADPRVGLTGPRVLSRTGRLVDGGLAFHRQRVQPMYADLEPLDPGPDGLLQLTREVSGLGGTCLALRRQTFDQVGGLTQHHRVLFDADLSHKVRWAGLSRVWVSEATVWRLTPPHRTPLLNKEAAAAFRRRWSGPPVDDYVPAFGSWHLERDQARLEV